MMKTEEEDRRREVEVVGLEPAVCGLSSGPFEEGAKDEGEIN